MHRIRCARTILLVGLLWGLTGTSVHAQQLLQNRSCESSDVSGWTEVDLTWDCTDRNPASPQDGTQYFWMDQTNPTGVLTLQQTVSATPGTVYSFTGQYFTENLSGDDEDLVGIVVNLLDGSGTVTTNIVATGKSENNNVVRTDGTWKTVSGLTRASENAADVRVELRVQDGASGGNVEAYLDNHRLIEKVQITEVMQNPNAVSDTDGEYVELYNTAATERIIDGWTLNGQSIGTVTIPARGFAVLCRNRTAAENGGVASCDDQVGFSLGDDTDTITLKNGAGLTIDRVSYDTGSGWPDPNGEAMVFVGLTGTSDSGNWTTASRRERGFRLDESGDLGSPGRNGAKQIVRPSVEVASGSAGWQMLSAPVSGVNVDTLAQANLVQGFSGHFPNAAPNLYQWPGGPIQTGDGSDDWQLPSGPEANLTSNGAGYIWFVFASTGTPKTDTPPFTMSVPGQSRITDVTTASLSGEESGNSAFHLLGNPYDREFDLSGLNLSSQGFQTTVQVWDPSANSYAAVTQASDGSDLLSDYQGFFVEKATSGSATLTFSASERTFSSSTSLKSVGDGPSQVAFRLTGRSAEGNTITQDRALALLFRSGASTQWDRHDASKLTPLSGRYVTAAFRGPRAGDSTQQAVRSLPPNLPGESTELPIGLRAQDAGAVDSLTLAWPTITGLPETWTLRLHDTAADTTVNLRTQPAYTFSSADATKQRPASTLRDPGRVPPPRAPGTGRSSAKAAGASSRLTLAIQTNPLPVELTRFEAAVSGDRARLSWRTASETNNVDFRIEHRGPAGKTFRPIGFVEGAGTTTAPQTYQHTTDPLETGPHTFRLYQIDADGTDHLSGTQTVEVRPEGSISATVRPHPVPRAGGTLDLTVGQQQEVRVDVYDLLGRRVGRLYEETLSDNQSVDVPIHPRKLGLHSGLYLLKIEGKTVSKTKRLVIVR